MLSVEFLRRDQFKQVAEWEFGPQSGDVDWDWYEAEMSAPRWSHFAIYIGEEFVGCVSLEEIGGAMAAFHVVTARRRVHPVALSQILQDMASRLFKRGFTGFTAAIPREKRAAAWLALRCGMREWGHTPTMRFFILTERGLRNYLNGSQRI